MPSRFLKLSLFLLLALGAVIYWPWREIRHAPGVLAAAEPVQHLIPPKALPPVADYNLEAVATYELTARILSTKRYWSGVGSDLVPVDVAVGWGRMSDQAVLDCLTLSQGNRFFFYEWQQRPPISPGEIESHAANMHIIAADSSIARSVKKLRTGELVHFRGLLVNASTSDHFTWRTSLSRTDTGRGACELFYVQELTPAAEMPLQPEPERHLTIR